MNFALSEEQEMLQAAAREILERECPPAIVRRTYGSADGLPSELQRTMAAAGWTGLLIPTEYGGLGLSMLDMAVLIEELGRAAAPGPFVVSSALATLALVAGGSAAQKRAWLPRLAAGDALATVALLEESERLDADGITLVVRSKGGRLRLSGTKMFVPFAAIADLLIVAVRTEESGDAAIRLALVERDSPGLSIAPLEVFDQTTRVSEVTFDAVEIAADALLESSGFAAIQRLLDAACVCLAADSLGGAAKALDLAVEYTQSRHQFGRPVASFQALKHIAAEIASEIEPARSLVWYAAYAFDHETERTASRLASMAKARLTEVYSRAANRALQMHGGIGFTWEHDIHFWLKRAKWNEVAFGEPAVHRERVVELTEF